eukprot:TRINITY_DN723_c0_g1_i1.p1 TRINITY_DN723_c0_g1~~TRINITY_DN723_c0_g1_i1.p1  ORF type:complete len:528 (+),score=248.12 TRINITY_DN723_c0_g1_i1:137-1585(+)
MMSILTSTARRSFASFSTPKTLFGRNTNTNVGLLSTGFRSLSSSTGPRHSTATGTTTKKTETEDNKVPFTRPLPPSTPEEQEELNKMYEEINKMKDVLVSQLNTNNPFVTGKMPDYMIDKDLTPEQQSMSDQMNEFLTEFNKANPLFPPQMMMEAFGTTDPLSVDLKDLFKDIQKNKDLAYNEYIDEDGTISTFHPPHTLNDQNSFVTEDGDRCHYDDIEPEHIFDQEGDIIPELHSRFLERVKFIPDFYPKKRDFTRLAEEAKMEQESNKLDEIIEEEEDEYRKRLKEGSTKELEEEEEDEDEDDPNSPEEPDAFGFTTEERELMKEESLPGYPPLTDDFIDRVEKQLDEEEAEDIEEITAEQDGSEDRAASQKDDEFSDDGTFELNKFITDRTIVVGNDSSATANSRTSTSTSTNDDLKQQQLAEELQKLIDRFGETFVRSVTEPNFRPEPSPLIKSLEKKASSDNANSKKGSSDGDLDF